MRTTVNVIDDCVVATIIAAGEGELNRDLLTSGDTWDDVV
jgi:Na+/H+-dicarboxylate symporter